MKGRSGLTATGEVVGDGSLTLVWIGPPLANGESGGRTEVGRVVGNADGKADGKALAAGVNVGNLGKAEKAGWALGKAEKAG